MLVAHGRTPGCGLVGRWAFLISLVVLSQQPLAALALEQDEQPAEAYLDWPREFVKDGHSVIVYQPQIDRWDDFETLSAVAAVAVTIDGAAASEYGSVRWTAKTIVDHESRDVLLGSRTFTGMMFPDSPAELYERVREVVDLVLPNEEPLVMSLDEIVAYLDTRTHAPSAIEVGLDPPPIFYSDEPAILVIFFGEPQLEPIEGTNLLFAVNTNWDVFLELGTSDYYLLHGEGWLTTKDPVSGSWKPADALPEGLGNLPEGEDWDEVRAHLPGKPITKAPRVFSSQEPAELIITDGIARFAPIAGTSLLSVANTDSDLFIHAKETQFYLITAGRWFRAPSLNGPWSAATNDLPDDFGLIPEDDPHAYVLASVPGTPDAQAAILLASVPNKATINRSEVSVSVVYEGEPQFIVIDSTEVSYAANTAYDVFRVDDLYYCCYQGIWFNATVPTGPWAVSTFVPPAIYTIPSTSPMHNVTYVYVYESTPETVVVGQTSGYSGQYVAFGLLMFGLGYAIADDDWNHYHYNPHYYSYGCAARYDYSHGGYYRAAASYGPYGGVGRSAAFNPATGTYSRGAAKYGPRGSAFAREAYNPYTGGYAARAGATTPYGSWGRSVIGNDDDWISAGHRSGARGTAVGVETSEGGKALAGQGRYGNRGAVGQTSDGDVYASRNGNVYRREGDGTWQHRSDGDWNAPDRDRNEKSSLSTADRERLQKDAQARDRGSDRASRFQSTRNSGSGTRRSPARGSTGGRRGRR